MRSALLFACLALVACGDDDGSTDEPSLDGGPPGVDGGAVDGGPALGDAGLVADGGPASDAGPVDGGPPSDLGLGPCSATLLGSECTDSCSRGYECVDGACMPPASRPGCGGFAGATCDTRAFPHCVYYESSDYGPCLSEEEFACACSSAIASRFACPER
jgi:hypothetical protein